jgi:lipoprotein Spr
MIKKVVFLSLFAAFITGCTSTNSKYVQSDKSIQDKIEKNNRKIELQRAEYVHNALMDFYNKWKGVKYKFGGDDRKGIDCSAFTQKVFKEKFDLDIPRTTRTQVKIGTTVKKSELELGDLIFFKTGRVDRHVGIYIGEGKFMHASIKGVKVTKLNKPFYKKAYWTSKRVIDQNPPYIASTTGI